MPTLVVCRNESKNSCSPSTRGPLATDKILVSRTINSNQSSRPTMTVSLCVAGVAHPLAAMVDSVADASFLDTRLARSLGIQLTPLSSPLKTTFLDGSPLWEVTHHTVPVQMTFSNDHSEDITFFAYSLSLQPIMLGLPWLQRHNPVIDWTTGRITFNSVYCKSSCLPPASPPAMTVPVCVDPDPPDISGVPPCYHDLREVFSKT